MAPASVATGATPAGTPDLSTFNRWLCITRLRASGAVFVFVLALWALGIDRIAVGPVTCVCLGLCAVSGIGLRWRLLQRAPRTFFYLQSFADLAGITVGLDASAHGIAALLLRSLYCLVIVPSSLISVPSGIAAAGMASAGHLVLLGHERGFSPETFGSLECLAPPFLYFLLAQQCFFYGRHLQLKNVALTTLATRLEDSRRRLVSEAKMSAALLDVAKTLSSTLEAPELLGRLNSTT